MAGPVVHLIPHTHWDREWYLTRAGFGARLVPMLDDLLERLEVETAFRAFLLDGQTVLMEDYLRVRPERRERLARLVAGGRLQVGPWYVLPDELIPSGESLVRNLLAGAADAARLGGRLDVLYCPDAFGHPAVLPALAREFGIGSVVLWRGLGGEPGQDRDLYRWRAPDGRDVLLFHLSADGYEAGAALPAGWRRLREELLRRAATPHLGVMVGADHHAAHRALDRACESIEQEEPDATVRVSRLDEFLRLAEQSASDLPVLEGELRWSYGYTWTLQGVHGTRAALKRRHALAELGLERGAEPLAALELGHRLGDSRALLAEAWRTLLRCQFHDSIAGCTSDPVARRVEGRIEDAATIAGEAARGSADAVLGNDPDLARERPEGTAPALVVWNPAARPRGGVIVADLTWLRRDVLVGPPGSRVPRVGASPAEADVAEAAGGLPVQPLGRALGQERLDAPHHYPDQDEVEITRVALRMPPVGGLGFAVVEDAGVGDPEDATPVTLRQGCLQNGLVRVDLTSDRVSLTDLGTGRRWRRLFSAESEPDLGDTYSHAGAGRSAARVERWRVVPVASGPLVGAVRLEGRLTAGRDPAGARPGRVDLRLTLSLHSGSAAVRCTLEVENRAGDHRLRLRFHGAAPSPEVMAGGPFGPVPRHPVEAAAAAYPRETPVPTAPAHRWVAGLGPGLALLAPGFFEYEHTSGGDLVFTVLRAVGRLSAGDLPTRPGHAGWPTATPLAQSPGADRLQLALLPQHHCGPNDGARLAESWEDVFLPLRAVWLRQATRLAPPPGTLTLEGAGLVLSAVKPAVSGRGCVLRCYNATQRPTQGRWRLPFTAASAAMVRADEQEPRAVALEDSGRTVRFAAGPRAIVTVAVEV